MCRISMSKMTQEKNDFSPYQLLSPIKKNALLAFDCVSFLTNLEANICTEEGGVTLSASSSNRQTVERKENQ